MPPAVVMGAMMQCSFGVAPASLVVVPMGSPVMISNLPAATIMDHKPIMNIPTFGMCTTPSNPVVAAATTAALGVLTPMPCVPVTVAPWTPGSSSVMVNNMPALHSGCTCNCQWGGVITISNPGQMTTQIT
ncbi:MAG: DUF4280 domain-containing protein [Aggregatilineales bacterium]